MRALFILPFLILFAASCDDAPVDSLAADPTIASSFSLEELNDLQLIYDWFNSEICNGDEAGIAICYDNYCKQLVDSMDRAAGSIQMNLDYSGLQEVLTQIDSSTFNEIWYVGWKRKGETDEYKRRIALLPNGKYAQFLAQASAQNPMIQQYAESFFAAGDITPSSFAGVLFNYQRLNLSDVKARLLLAIHYATFLDNEQRDETITPPAVALPIESEVPMSTEAPLQDGEYEFSIHFAEWGKDSGAKAKVEIQNGLAIVTYMSGNLTGIEPGVVMTTGQLLQHKSGVWMITSNPEDVNLAEVGGCVDGPYTLDLDKLIFWIC